MRIILEQSRKLIIINIQIYWLFTVIIAVDILGENRFLSQ